MKKALAIAAIVMTVMACNNPNPGESGAVNDGFNGAGDNNGALPGDTGYGNHSNSIDTAAMDDRVDIQQRDSMKKK